MVYLDVVKMENVPGMTHAYVRRDTLVISAITHVSKSNTELAH